MEKVIQRLQLFIESKGGVTAVAQKLGNHPNKFYVMLRGETKPNSSTIHDLKINYPDLDLNWLFAGVESKSQTFLKLELPQSEIEKENNLLKKEIELLKSDLDEAKEDKRAYRAMLRH